MPSLNIIQTFRNPLAQTRLMLSDICMHVGPTFTGWVGWGGRGGCGEGCVCVGGEGKEIIL